MSTPKWTSGLAHLRSLLTAALGFLQVDQTNLSHTGLTALHAWLDNWRGVGAITDGMLRQGFETDLTGGPDGWSATFLKTRSIGGVEMVGSAHDNKAWKAVQLAAWKALMKTAQDTKPS